MRPTIILTPYALAAIVAWAFVAGASAMMTAFAAFHLTGGPC